MDGQPVTTAQVCAAYIAAKRHFFILVLFLMLLQEDLFLFLNLRPKLLLRRKKQLILAREYGFVVLRQGEPYRRVVLLSAEQYANGRILVRLLLVAVVVVDIELKLPKVLMRQLVIFYLLCCVDNYVV